MLPITREVATSYDGPTVACPSCHARIAISPPTGWSIRSPRDIYAHLGVELAALEREELRILLLNTKNVVLRVVTVYAGNVSASLVRVGELFREAVRDNVTSVVLVHNHPSGDATPPTKSVGKPGSAKVLEGPVGRRRRLATSILALQAPLPSRGCQRAAASPA
jgi:hypothetical protein